MDSPVLARSRRPALLYKPLLRYHAVGFHFILHRIPIHHPQRIPMLVENHHNRQARHRHPVLLAQGARNQQQGIAITGIHVCTGVEIIILRRLFSSAHFAPADTIRPRALLLREPLQRIQTQLAVLLRVLLHLCRVVVALHVGLADVKPRELGFGDLAVLHELDPPVCVDAGADRLLVRLLCGEDACVPLLYRGWLVADRSRAPLVSFEGAETGEADHAVLSRVDGSRAVHLAVTEVTDCVDVRNVQAAGEDEAPRYILGWLVRLSIFLGVNKVEVTYMDQEPLVNRFRGSEGGLCENVASEC